MQLKFPLIHFKIVRKNQLSKIAIFKKQICSSEVPLRPKPSLVMRKMWNSCYDLKIVCLFNTHCTAIAILAAFYIVADEFCFGESIDFVSSCELHQIWFNYSWKLFTLWLYVHLVEYLLLLFDVYFGWNEVERCDWCIDDETSHNICHPIRLQSALIKWSSFVIFRSHFSTLLKGDGFCQEVSDKKCSFSIRISPFLDTIK